MVGGVSLAGKRLAVQYVTRAAATMTWFVDRFRESRCHIVGVTVHIMPKYGNGLRNS